MPGAITTRATRVSRRCRGWAASSPAGIGGGGHRRVNCEGGRDATRCASLATLETVAAGLRDRLVLADRPPLDTR